MIGESLSDALEFCEWHPAELVPCGRCDHFDRVRLLLADRFGERARRRRAAERDDERGTGAEAGA